MSTPYARTSGGITTTGIAISTGTGAMSFAASSTGGTLRVYDGTSSAGTLICQLASAAKQTFNPPVHYQTGLYCVPSTTIGSSSGGSGGAVVHYL